MNGVERAHVNLEELICELKRTCNVTLLSGLGGMKRRLLSPQVLIYGVKTGKDEGMVLIREGAEAPTHRSGSSILALFISQGLNKLNWLEWGDRFSIPVFTCEINVYRLASKLKGLLRELLDGVKMVHASLVEFRGQGVLITGPSGAGKSNLAWVLIKKGGRLVADDLVIIERRGEGVLMGRAPDPIKGYIHLRGKGLVRVNPKGIVEEVPVLFNVDLSDRGAEGARRVRVCGVDIPQIKLKGGGGEGLARKVEKLAV